MPRKIPLKRSRLHCSDGSIIKLKWADGGWDGANMNVFLWNCIISCPGYVVERVHPLGASITSKSSRNTRKAQVWECVMDTNASTTQRRLLVRMRETLKLNEKEAFVRCIGGEKFSVWIYTHFRSFSFTSKTFFASAFCLESKRERSLCTGM